MTDVAARAGVERVLGRHDGVLRLMPTWVARDWLPPGRRLGLPEDQYDVGERGYICERWLGSTTKADNRVGPADEGLSYVDTDVSEPVTLDWLVRTDPIGVMGAEYASRHEGLGRLAKIFDYSARIPYHIHPRIQHSRLVGRNPKDEAYYFPPGVDMGQHPESFFGVHPWIAESRAYDTLLPYLEEWNSDAILRHARGMVQVAGEGFHIPSGVLHAPGTALTIELQEDSDCLAMFQALNAGTIISKELLFKDVRTEDRQRWGERFLLEWVDWEVNGDPYFYENRHLEPRPLTAPSPSGARVEWIFYNTAKFSGKRVTVSPGERVSIRERGVHNILVWQGSGTYAGLEVEGGQPGLDELLVVHDRAVSGFEIVNTGVEELVVIQFFGPDVYDDVPRIAPWSGGSSAPAADE